MTRRPLTLDDLPAALATWNAAEAADDLPIRTPLDELEDDLTQEGLQLPRDSVGVFSDDGTCLGFGWVWRMPRHNPQFRSARIHVAVHPDHTGQGLGRSLLQQLTDSGDRLLAEWPREGLPRMLMTLVDGRQAAAHHLLDDIDFSVLRYIDELSVPLGDPAATRLSPKLPELPPGLDLIDWDPTRSREAKGVMRGAFADHWGSMPVSETRWQRLTSAPRFQPALSGMVVRPHPSGDPNLEAVVGFCLVQLWPEEWPVTGRKDARIEVLAVSRSARRRGVATTLIHRTLARCRDQDLTHATLSVDTASPSGAHTLYANLGFKPVTRLQIWGRPCKEG